MKRNAFIFVALMVFSFGLANAQDAADIVMPVAGTWDDGGTPSVNTGVDVDFIVHLTVATATVTGHTNGFRIYLSNSDGGPVDPGGVYGAADTFTILDLNLAGYDDGGYFVNMFSANGMGADTVGLGGFALFKGLPVGFDEDVLRIRTSVGAGLSDGGSYLCIDSTFYPPGGAWLWSAGGNVIPAFGGPYCWYIKTIPNLCPTIDNCPGATQNFDHCAVATIDFTASDNESDAISWQLASGPGGIVGANTTAQWSYAPVLADVGTSQNIVVQVTDAFHNFGDCVDCQVNLGFTNVAPTITDCGPGLIKVGKGNSVNYQVTGTSNDCDPVSYYIANVSPAPVGTYGIDANTGLVTFNSDNADAPTTFTFTVCITDGVDEDCCDFDIEVLATEPFGVQIEKTHMSYQGAHELVDVFQWKGSEYAGGFDFLIAYDASALSFQAAFEGDLYAKCGWEYFTYRYGASGNCHGGCPSGLLRVVGIAETNNGANHPVPDCGLLPGETFFTLDFLVSDNRTFECQYVPIRFFWLDCGDNTISNQGGDTLWISDRVFDFEGNEITDPFYGWPTYFGAQDECTIGGGPNKPVPIRFIDFVNGGVDIACADSIDARGDLNLNGISNEIADGVLYSNYFVHGIGVFTINVFGQTAASDVNADGIALSVADLVYLIRVIVGDALPYPKLAPVDVSVTFGSELTVDQKMGAAAVVIEGQADPVLLADNMKMEYAYDADEDITRVLVFSMKKDQTFEGSFLVPNGNVLSIELATYDGTPAKVDMVPANYALNQNYPNPFNPTTTISASLAQAGNYDLTVYNVTGQEVASYAGFAEAGVIEIEFDASNLASGVYFYKFTAGAFTDTKKMVLLK